MRELIETEINTAVNDALNRVWAAVCDVPGGADMTVQEITGMFAAVLRLSGSAVLRASAQMLEDTSERPMQQ